MLDGVEQALHSSPSISAAVTVSVFFIAELLQ
jgi:hypothetical protein